jgi:undecaprenyl-diphosphatase
VDGAALALGATGAALLVASVVGARQIHPLERRVFRSVNRLPDWLYRPLWVPMQLGNLVVGTAVGLAVAAAYHSWRLALSVVVAALLKLGAEKVLRTRLTALAATRQRPATSQVGAVLRGDVPTAGPSFPSGHVILVTAVACAVVDHLPVAVVGVPFALVVLVMFGRVYVGAHNPLDVTAGLGAGLLVGGVLLLVSR